jgi:hypothetical protein
MAILKGSQKFGKGAHVPRPSRKRKPKKHLKRYPKRRY